MKRVFLSSHFEFSKQSDNINKCYSHQDKYPNNFSAIPYIA
ncbi:hypothetical protein ECP03047993_3090, partial [Escherichia coli P0304799.3]